VKVGWNSNNRGGVAAPGLFTSRGSELWPSFAQGHNR
jgi:hypothetical protein